MGVVAFEQGWCRFDHVTLPRIALLARYGHVAESGEWEPPPPRFGKRSYATMLLIRAAMVAGSANGLGKAATIAVRYCAVRRQFRRAGSSAETQVLDYPQVAMRTLPWLATAYALKCTGAFMTGMYFEMELRVERGDTDMEKEVHAVGSCLKCVCTTLVVDGVEELRRVCGGHGYSMYSGMQEIYGNSMVNFTGEGENYMIVQQASKALLRVDMERRRRRRRGKGSGRGSDGGSGGDSGGDDCGSRSICGGGGGGGGDRCNNDGTTFGSPNFSFVKPKEELEGEKMPTDADLDDLPTLVRAFEHRAARLLADTADVADAAAGDTSGVAALEGPAQWEGIRAAWAFGEMLILRAFAENCRERTAETGEGDSGGDDAAWQATEAAKAFGVGGGRVPDAALGVLSTLARLFALNLIMKNLADYLLDGYMTPTQGRAIAARVKSLLLEVRPLAVPLVDAMNFTDSELNSAIGRQDGAVYETLLDWAKRDPMNEGKVIKGFHEHYGKVLAMGRQSLLEKTGSVLEDLPGVVQQQLQQKRGIARL
jgi:acyl-CoA oxidase